MDDPLESEAQASAGAAPAVIADRTVAQVTRPAAPVTFKKRKAPKGGNLRKRARPAAEDRADDEDGDGADARTAGDDDDDEGAAEAGLADVSLVATGAAGPRSKRGTAFSSGGARREAIPDALAFAASGEAAPLPVGGAATAVNEADTDFSRDARAIHERNLLLNETGEAADGTVYKGMAAYRNHIARDKERVTSMNKVTGTQGPLRAPLHIRQSIRVDYQPDICKDWKETGYCAFGDTCKFIHDRGNFKTGWQLEAEWKAKEKKRQEAIRRGEDPDALEAAEEAAAAAAAEEDERDVRWFREKVGQHGQRSKAAGDRAAEEQLPFACLICRQHFTRPVVTKCGHYFCEACALRHYQTSARCFACKQPTEGVFNFAKKLDLKIRDLKRRIAAQQQGELPPGDSGEHRAASGGASSSTSSSSGGGGGGGGGWAEVAPDPAPTDAAISEQGGPAAQAERDADAASEGASGGAGGAGGWAVVQ